MRYRTRLQLFTGRLDTAAFMSVFFYAAFIFILAMSFDFQHGFQVNLPKVQGGSSLAAERLVIVISMPQDKSRNSPDEAICLFNARRVQWSDLDYQLSSVIKGRRLPGERLPIVSVKAGREVPYDCIMRVLAAAQRLNVTVNLVTDPSPTRPEAAGAAD
ncbi:MAG: Biopolymer transport protein ExbD/TolR [Verrucomicrobiota bacterium]|jgi:biopolymer transport protein ExbD